MNNTTKTPTQEPKSYLNDFSVERPKTALPVDMVARMDQRQADEEARDAARRGAFSQEVRRRKFGQRILAGAVATAAVLTYAHSTADKGTGINYPSIEHQRKAYEPQPANQGDHVPQANITLPDGSQGIIQPPAQTEQQPQTPINPQP